MTDILDLDRLEKLAEAATPEWSTNERGEILGPEINGDEYVIGRLAGGKKWERAASGTRCADYREAGYEQGKANAAYIAAMSPATALALIARVRELEGELSDAEAAMKKQQDEIQTFNERVEEWRKC